MMILFFLSKQKKIIYNKSDLLPIYMHRKRTQENSYYLNKKLSSENDNNNDKIKDNKIDKENKENIPNNKSPRVLASNKAT